MKKILTLTIMLVAAIAGFAEDKYAQATFTEKRHDFGQIQEMKGPVTHTFEFTNTGNKPLIIVEAVASCGCTRPEYPTKPIKPGKKGKIKVTYNPIGRPGGFSKSVRVKTNGREHFSTLIIEGVTIPKGTKSDE